MEFICQIHNIGIYIDGSDETWVKKIKSNAGEQLDGFEIYNNCMPIEKKLIMRNYADIEDRNDCITVPECSRYFSDDTFYTEYIEVAFQFRADEAIMWTKDVTWYIPYMLEVLFVQQGMCFVHGAGVSLDHKDGKLLLAFGGIGKTCFVANAVKKDGVNLLGDDLILVSKEGKLYSYPRPFCLYEYHKPLFPQYFSKHKVKYKHITKDMYFARIIHRAQLLLHIPDKAVYTFLAVSPVRLFPEGTVQIEPVDLKSIHILRRNESVTTVKTGQTAVSNEMAKNFALDVILHEWDVGLKVVLNRYAQKFESINNYIKERELILSAAFQNITDIECVEIPLNMNAVEVSRELNNIILGGN